MRVSLQFNAELKTLSKALKHMGHGKGAGHVVRNALNHGVVTARTKWHQEMSRVLILRNNFAKSSVTYDRATGTDILKLRAVIGSRVRLSGKSDSNMMHKVEFGESESKKGEHGVAVPTGYAAGQEGANPTTKVVRARFRIDRTNVEGINKEVERFQKPNQRNAATIAIARKRSVAFGILETKSGVGLYKINKGRAAAKKKKRRKRRSRAQASPAPVKFSSSGAPKLVWSYHNPTVRMRPHPTLEPTVNTMRRLMPNIFTAYLKKQFLFYRK